MDTRSPEAETGTQERLDPKALAAAETILRRYNIEPGTSPEEVLHQLRTLRGLPIQKFLHAVREGLYGVCENCGKRIRNGRLAVIPEAVTCTKCETEREATEGPEVEDSAERFERAASMQAHYADALRASGR